MLASVDCKENMQNSENNEKPELMTSFSSFMKRFSKGESNKSKAWDYFDKKPDKCYCKYKVCNQTYSLGTATTQLIKHYTESHLKNSEKNQTVINFDKKITFDCKKSSDFFLKWIVHSLQPLSIVEDKYFKEIISSLNPSFKVCFIYTIIFFNNLPCFSSYPQGKHLKKK